jgi:hypothetical protein
LLPNSHNWARNTLQIRRMRISLTAFLAVVLLLDMPNAHAQTPANAYPSVNQMPPSRDAPALTADERSQLKKDLSSARDRQTGAAKAKDKDKGAH